jgi:hypothetical protein
MNYNSSNNRKAVWKRSDGKSRTRRRGSSRPTIGRSIDRRINTYWNAGRQALRDINRLRQFINTEIKSADITATEASSTTPTFDLVNGLIPGNGNGQRTGQSVKCQNVDMRFILTINASATTSFARIIMVMDKQTNSAVFAIGSLLNAGNVYSAYTVGGQNRFIVMYDQTFALNNNGEQTASVCVRLGFQPHTEYNTGTAGTVADINTNSIYFVHLSDQATNTIAISYYIRYWYVDN